MGRMLTPLDKLGMEPSLRDCSQNPNMPWPASLGIPLLSW